MRKTDPLPTAPDYNGSRAQLANSFEGIQRDCETLERGLVRQHL